MPWGFKDTYNFQNNDIMKPTTKKELSYFRLKLENYLREHHPEKVNDRSFIIVRADEGLTAYCDSISQGFSHPEAEMLAGEVLFEGLHFSRYDLLITIMEQEFEKELPNPLPERLVPMLIKNKAIQDVFAKYDLSDDFESREDYEELYTELTGTIVLLIEYNRLPTSVQN